MSKYLLRRKIINFKKNEEHTLLVPFVFDSFNDAFHINVYDHLKFVNQEVVLQFKILCNNRIIKKSCAVDLKGQKMYLENENSSFSKNSILLALSCNTNVTISFTLETEEYVNS